MRWDGAEEVAFAILVSLSRGSGVWLLACRAALHGFPGSNASSGRKGQGLRVRSALDVAQEMSNYVCFSVPAEKRRGSEPGAGPLWREYYGALAMSVPPANKPADFLCP